MLSTIECKSRFSITPRIMIFKCWQQESMIGVVSMESNEGSDIYFLNKYFIPMLIEFILLGPQVKNLYNEDIYFFWIFFHFLDCKGCNYFIVRMKNVLKLNGKIFAQCFIVNIWSGKPLRRMDDEVRVNDVRKKMAD